MPTSTRPRPRPLPSRWKTPCRPPASREPLGSASSRLIQHCSPIAQRLQLNSPVTLGGRSSIWLPAQAFIERSRTLIGTQHPENGLARAEVTQFVHGGVHQSRAHPVAPMLWQHVEQIDHTDFIVVRVAANPYEADRRGITDRNQHPLATGYPVLQ